MPLLLAGGVCWVAADLGEEAGVDAAGVVDLVVAGAGVGAEALEPEAASALSAFLDLEDFLVVEESAAVASAESAFLDLEVDALVEEVSAEVLSAVPDFLDFEDFLVEAEASDVASSVDFFFFLDLVVELESD
jgi:hypothetical protein